MYNKALEVLNIFCEHGYVAYIVGGYPRDSILEIKTSDIDICTDARPKEIMEIFASQAVSDVSYGSVKVIYKNSKFDVTTFRKDIKYVDNRRPIKIKYINNLKKDLLRRDFTINTICIDKDGNIIDLLNARSDINKRLIRTVGNPRYRIKEDSLRILRAIRFASILDFDIDDKTGYYLTKYGCLLNNLSKERKKEELNKIFSSCGKEKGRKLILKYKLEKYLNIDNIANIVMCDDIIGIWTQLNVENIYNFSKLEKEQMKLIKELMSRHMDKYNIYKYGLYISMVVCEIKGYDKVKVNNIYNKLPILNKSDICISANDIAKILNRRPGAYLKEILKDIEKEILKDKLDNTNEDIEKYIIEKYN